MNILTYSFRQKTWTWNIDEILGVEITKNVLDLISIKLINLPPNILNALKIASTFGIKIHDSIVQDLSRTAQYSKIRSDLNKALEDGLMDFDTDGSFRFPHDKVRALSSMG
jgi:predicted ATPase